MTNFYSVSSASYDGTSGSPNPICTVVGTVNNRNVVASTYFSYLMAASNVGEMQNALSAILFNRFCDWYGLQYLPWPTPLPLPCFPLSNAVAAHTQGPHPAPVVVDAALIGAWIA
jgi:hypothetical protein